MGLWEMNSEISISQKFREDRAMKKWRYCLGGWREPLHWIVGVQVEFMGDTCG